MDKKEQIRKLISNNDIAEAIRELKAALPGNHSLTMREAGWKQLRHDEMMGVVDYKDTNIRRNQIIGALLALTDEVGKPAAETPLNSVSQINLATTSSQRKVFISYNHHDRPTANKIRDLLRGKGFSVTIDHEAVAGGQNIQAWITECLRTHDYVVSLVSSRSLRSGWVGMESAMAFFAEKLKEKDTHFVPVMLDRDFFKRSFVDEVLDEVETEIADIDKTIENRRSKGRRIEDLQADLSRLNDLKNNLPNIVDRLKNSLTIDAAGEAFPSGMEVLFRTLG